MTRLTALAALLLPLAAQAEPIELTGTDSIHLWWPPATGPVVSYATKLVYEDGQESAIFISLVPPHKFAPRKGVAFKLSVRACYLDAAGTVACAGPWSEPGRELKMCPMQADVDCKLKDGKMIVGSPDFIILSNEWGSTAGE